MLTLRERHWKQDLMFGCNCYQVLSFTTDPFPTLLLLLVKKHGTFERFAPKKHLCCSRWAVVALTEIQSSAPPCQTPTRCKTPPPPPLSGYLLKTHLLFCTRCTWQTRCTICTRWVLDVSFVHIIAFQSITPPSSPPFHHHFYFRGPIEWNAVTLAKINIGSRHKNPANNF